MGSASDIRHPTSHIRALGLDPSSTRVGYAVMSGPDAIVDAGYLTPGRTKDAAMARVNGLADDCVALIDDVRPDLVVIEIPSGKVGTGQRRGAGATLAIYGLAVGAIYWATRCAMGNREQGTGNRGPDTIVTVTEREWTGLVAKRRRQALIARLFPMYAQHMGEDGGADVADAIGLLRWWFLSTRALAAM